MTEVPGDVRVIIVIVTLLFLLLSFSAWRDITIRSTCTPTGEYRYRIETIPDTFSAYRVKEQRYQCKNGSVWLEEERASHWSE